MDPADRLRKARERAGYQTASDGARALGIPIQTYIAHETGQRGFSRHAIRYSTFFRVNLSWLLEGKGRMDGKSEVDNLYESLPDEEKWEALNFLKYLASKHLS
jgi:hypothetical protein